MERAHHEGFSRSLVALLVALPLLACPGLDAQDVTPPAEVDRLTLSRNADDIALFWTRVTRDVTGADESRTSYRVYRGADPAFLADREAGSNEIDSPSFNFSTDRDAIGDGSPLYLYLVSAVDEAGNEGNIRPSDVTVPPMLDAAADDDSIDLTWSGEGPRARVAGFRAYHGLASGPFTGSRDEPATASGTSLTCLEPGLHALAVTALDAEGNESSFSNRVEIATAGNVRVPVLEEAQITPSAHTATADVALPAPEAWSRVTARLTVDSRLSIPCSCSGGGECGGDPWDRTISVFMENPDPTGPRIELIHAITPFGTDARTGPRVYEMDITPLAPLLTGSRTLGVNITTWVGEGWFVDLELDYSRDPCQASAKPAAAGLQPLYYRPGVTAGNQDQVPSRSVTIPAAATQVLLRLFVSGHGGGTDPGCGNPADEFCPRTNRILVDASPAWSQIVWNSCPDDCSPWNACGFPSCTFPRSGWCPGFITCHEDPPCDQDLDMTTVLSPGGTYDVLYEIQDIGDGGSWFYSLLVYWYE